MSQCDLAGVTISFSMDVFGFVDDDLDFLGSKCHSRTSIDLTK